MELTISAVVWKSGFWFTPEELDDYLRIMRCPVEIKDEVVDFINSRSCTWRGGPLSWADARRVITRDWKEHRRLAKGIVHRTCRDSDEIICGSFHISTDRELERFFEEVEATAPVRKKMQ